LSAVLGGETGAGGGWNQESSDVEAGRSAMGAQSWGLCFSSCCPLPFILHTNPALLPVRPTPGGGQPSGGLSQLTTQLFPEALLGCGPRDLEAGAESSSFPPPPYPQPRRYVGPRIRSSGLSCPSLKASWLPKSVQSFGRGPGKEGGLDEPGPRIQQSVLRGNLPAPELTLFILDH
jgi:hypothetical protein